MRQLFLGLLVGFTLGGCGSKSTAPKPQPNTSPSIPTKEVQPADTKPTSTAASIAATTSAPASTSAPTSMTTIKPWIEQPSAPPPEGALEYDEWIKVTDFPAISDDGKLFVTITAEGYDERDEVGDAVKMILFDIEKNEVKQTVDLLLPKETYEDTPKKVRDKLLVTVKPRIEAAQKALDGVKWLPLEAVEGEGEENNFARDNVTVSFSEEKDALLTIRVDGKVAKEQTSPKWIAPGTPPCPEEGFVLECGCAYPILLSELLIHRQLRVLVMSVEYMVSHACESSPPQFFASVRY